MELLSEAEYEFFQWYRALCDKEKLAVRRYIHLGDPQLLPIAGDHRERVDRLWSLSVPQGDKKHSLFGA